MRPIREQFEHDRIVRLLQVKYKRKFRVGINVGADQVVPVGKGNSQMFPDLVLQASDPTMLYLTDCNSSYVISTNK